MKRNGNDLWNEQDMVVEDSAFDVDIVEAVCLSDLKHALDFTESELGNENKLLTYRLSKLFTEVRDKCAGDVRSYLYTTVRSSFRCS